MLTPGSREGLRALADQRYATVLIDLTRDADADVRYTRSTR